VCVGRSDTGVARAASLQRKGILHSDFDRSGDGEIPFQPLSGGDIPPPGVPSEPGGRRGSGASRTAGREVDSDADGYSEEPGSDDVLLPQRPFRTAALCSLARPQGRETGRGQWRSRPVRRPFCTRDRCIHLGKPLRFGGYVRGGSKKQTSGGIDPNSTRAADALSNRGPVVLIQFEPPDDLAAAAVPIQFQLSGRLSPIDTWVRFD
jgi:hypothetical protein